jgi:hypothetical protein
MPASAVCAPLALALACALAGLLAAAALVLVLLPPSTPAAVVERFYSKARGRLEGRYVQVPDAGGRGIVTLLKRSPNLQLRRDPPLG